MKFQRSATLVKFFRECLILEQELAKFSLKGQLVNILGCTGHKVSVAATQFYHCSVKPAIDICKQMDVGGFQKTSLTKLGGEPYLACGQLLANPCLTTKKKAQCLIVLSLVVAFTTFENIALILLSGDS